MMMIYDEDYLQSTRVAAIHFNFAVMQDKNMVVFFGP